MTVARFDRVAGHHRHERGARACLSFAACPYHEATNAVSLSMGGRPRECQIIDCARRKSRLRAFGQEFDSPQLHTLEKSDLHPDWGWVRISSFFFRVLQSKTHDERRAAGTNSRRLRQHFMRITFIRAHLGFIRAKSIASFEKRGYIFIGKTIVWTKCTERTQEGCR